MRKIAHRDFHEKADHPRNALRQSAKTCVCGKKACGGKKERRDPELSVKRLIKEQRHDHPREKAEEKILRKDQYTNRTHAAGRRKLSEKRKLFLPQAGRGPAAGQKPRQPQAIIHGTEQNARQEGPEIQQGDCRLGKIHTAFQ